MATILIVDDSILMRRNLKMMLTEAGHQVVAEASNGIEAYKEYAKHMPDLVTMDITMPVMSGIDAVKKIIATYPAANIIMISALDQKSMVFEAIQNGAKHYILKPITMDKILETIDDVLKIHREEQQAAKAETAAGAAALPEAGAPAFAIENKNGIFIVTAFGGISAEELDSIGMAVQGFLFLKPLKVVFHFHDSIDSMDGDLLARFEQFSSSITGAGGTAKVVCRGKALTQQLKELNPELFGKVYTDISQIIL
ncbi:response regulator [Paenibacillus sp. GD4]|jgi:chemotaxis response regulator CheB|uniref:response regulator n=1 Tax=Paenibacillus sp. GD4 TaxID=3068890 RepID=UPI0027B93948|nr:response regulator [Paenibacillus sp. GD4]